MTDLRDILEELRGKNDSVARLMETLEEVKNSPKAVEELEYDFNLVNVGWGHFRALDVDKIEEVISELKELLRAVDKEDKDLMREKAKNVAKLIA